MKLLVERWIKTKSKLEGEIEAIVEIEKVNNEEEAYKKAKDWMKLKDTTSITLHYCYHDEDPAKPCERKYFKI